MNEFTIAQAPLMCCYDSFSVEHVRGIPQCISTLIVKDINLFIKTYMSFIQLSSCSNTDMSVTHKYIIYQSSRLISLKLAATTPAINMQLSAHTRLKNKMQI